jgi:hypothetical protein
MMNYVTLVNNAIQESGADLAEFETDGSDWDDYANTDMKSRFKTWVKRAWRTIQQEAFDWEWMSEQAVVNCTPGIMFYTKNEDVVFPTSPDTIDIYDAADDTIAEADVAFSSVTSLTGTYTNTLRYGYVNLVSDNDNPIDFSLKAGGEYFVFPQPVTMVRFVGMGQALA